MFDKLDTIGKRAAYAIEQRRLETGKRKFQIYGEINVTPPTVCNWRTGDTEPRSYHLQQMALRGYDVMWILLGGERNG